MAFRLFRILGNHLDVYAQKTPMFLAVVKGVYWWSDHQQTYAEFHEAVATSNNPNQK